MGHGLFVMETGLVRHERVGALELSQFDDSRHTVG